MAHRRDASSIRWLSPSNDCCSLAPMSGGAGLLEIEIHDGVVSVHSRNCLLKFGQEEDDFVEVAEYEFSLSLQRCQIDWSFVESTAESTIERSAYFSQ